MRLTPYARRSIVKLVFGGSVLRYLPIVLAALTLTACDTAKDRAEAESAIRAEASRRGWTVNTVTVNRSEGGSYKGIAQVSKTFEQLYDGGTETLNQSWTCTVLKADGGGYSSSCSRF